MRYDSRKLQEKEYISQDTAGAELLALGFWG